MLATLSLAVILGLPGMQEPDYEKELKAWRADVEASLMREQGWLAVVGLFWLKEGANAFGSDAAAAVVLPQGTPSRAGTFVMKGGKVSASVSEGVEATIAGKPFTSGDLRSDAESPDDKLRIGSVTLQVVDRSGKIGIRMWDANSKARTGFKGLEWYAPNPSMRIAAKYIAYEKPKEMPILNVLGQEYMVPNPGYVVFQVDGKSCRLEAQASGDGFFFNFKDATNGKTTYPAGRFLGADGAKDGVVILDFNRATNPPCAYTNFATCPLPPKSNFLSVAIPAGEKNFHIPTE